MNLIRTCIERPVGVSVGVLLIVLFGLLSLFSIPVQLTPTVDVTVIAVTTRWSGANPQEIEREIVDRQEEQLRSVKGLRKLTSASRDNFAEVRMEFYPEVDKDTALRDVNDKLRQVSNYPLEVDEPTVQAADSSVDNPIAWLILYPGDRAQDEKVRELRDFAEDFIKPYLDRVPGVASVDVYGGLQREVQVIVDPGELAARRLTLAQVRDALRRQNQNVSAGTRAQGKRDYAIRTVGQYEDAGEILDTVITATDSGPVYVRDVGRVEMSFKEAESFVRSKGMYVLALPVRREVGANVIAVMTALKKAIEQVNREVLQARSMPYTLEQVYDETVYIRQSIDMVRSNILYGSAMVLGLLLAFLRSWRATAVLALTIPVSIVGTFVVIVALGRTLNVISLAGIAFAVGDVVDSAYVVLENIYRHKQMGKSILQAVMDGTHEVWPPVLASTLTTMAVFVPVIFIREEAGQLFRDISIAQVAAVGLSMIVAITVIPPLAARLLKHGRAVPAFPEDEAPEEQAPAPRDVRAAEAALAADASSTLPGDSKSAAGAPGSAVRSGVRKTWDPVFHFAGFTARLVDRVNHLPVMRVAVIVIMTFGSLYLATKLIPDSTYLPAGNRNLVFGFLISPPGYSLQEYRRMAATIEDDLAPYWSVDENSPEQQALDQHWVQQVEQRLSVGTIADVQNPALGRLARGRARREWLTPPPLIDNFFYVSWGGSAFMGASSRDPARVKPLVRLLETASQRIPGVIPVFVQVQLFSFGGGNTAEIQIRGDNLEHVTDAAGLMMLQCLQRFGFPRPSPTNFNLGRPELRIVADLERASDLGLSTADIGFIVEACGDGAYVGDFRQSGGDTIDLSLYVAGERKRPTSEIAQVPIYAPRGQIVPLLSVVRLVDTTAQEQINHVERQRAVTLEVNPPEAMPLEAVMRQIGEMSQNLRDTGQIDPSVLVSLTGNADKLTEARNALVGEWKGGTLESLINIVSGRFLLSVLIVYLLMCALYESWVYPFVIMFSVPLAVLGGFLGLSAAHWGTLLTTDQPVQQLDVLTFLGFVMLVGLVVKNAILLVEQALVHLREYHMSRRHAIREAVRVRVRPVLMTSLTTVFGLLPLAIAPGAGTELYRGLASVILGGMIVSTLGTFVLVPSVLGLVLDIQAGVAAWRARSGGALPAGVPTREH